MQCKFFLDYHVFKGEVFHNISSQTSHLVHFSALMPWRRTHSHFCPPTAVDCYCFLLSAYKSGVGVGGVFCCPRTTLVLGWARILCVELSQ